MFCRAHVNSLNVKPDGNISICCASNRDWHVAHISEVDDLQELWNTNEEFLRIRAGEEDIINSVCGNCIERYQNGENNSYHSWNTPKKGKYARYNIRTDGKIRFLEFTTSNLCNQTCVTCSSYYSSKWNRLEQEALDMSLPLDKWKTPGRGGFDDFGQPIYRMTENDIEKLLPLLPDLDMLDVKGGEPFADANNYYILEELLKVNPTCSIFLTTNLAKVPEKYFNLFAKYDNFIRPSISMDGVGMTYQWVRSSPWENVVENMKRWRSSVKNTQLCVNHRVSIFNMFNLEDTIKWAYENIGTTIDNFVQMGWVYDPRYAAPFTLLNKKQIEKWLNSLELPTNKHLYVNNLYSLDVMPKEKPLEQKIHEASRKKWSHRAKLYTDFMNFQRGFDICDIHPELNQILRYRT